MKNCFKWVFKKKGPIFLAILLIFLFNSAVCLPTLSEQTASSIPQGQGIYVDEEITAPITQIGIPEEYWEPQVEENGLEIAWNQWHANVRNQLFRSIKNRDWPQGYSIWIIYTVDLNKNISNIVFMYYPEQAILNKNNVGYLKQNTDFYLYLYDSNKFIAFVDKINNFNFRDVPFLEKFENPVVIIPKKFFKELDVDLNSLSTNFEEEENNQITITISCYYKPIFDNQDKNNKNIQDKLDGCFNKIKIINIKD